MEGLKEMKRLIGTVLIGAVAASAASAAPLVPRIVSHDFAFGASDRQTFYEPRGADADWLTLNQDEGDQEVVALWPIWPVGGTPLMIQNNNGDFGGDLELALQFDNSDAPIGSLDVSLTGSGRNEGADLAIYGAIPSLNIPYGLLFSFDITRASLYGYGNASSFVLETEGLITFINQDLPGADSVQVGIDTAVSRGNIDFEDLALPSLYDPNEDYGLAADGGGYSGEAGPGSNTIPEPSSLALLALGGLALLRRRA